MVWVQWIREMNSRALARERGVGWGSLRVTVMKKAMYIRGRNEVDGQLEKINIPTQCGLGYRRQSSIRALAYCSYMYGIAFR